MPIIEIQRVAGIPKERVSVKNGTFFYDWLKTQQFHNDVVITVNGNKLTDDDDISFALTEHHNIQIFDQPKGIVGDIIGAPFKLVQKVFSFLAPRPPSFAGADSSVKESPNNRLTGQTNTARKYQARPDVCGQFRVYPDLIQESLFEYKDNMKMVTEWMNFGLGVGTVESVKYAESDLGAMAGASYKVYRPSEIIPHVVEGFEFKDIDGQELPGPNESHEIPKQIAEAEAVISGEIKGGEAAVTIVKQDEFEYFFNLVFPHSVSMIVNVSYVTPQGSVTRDVTIDGQLVDAKETDDGAILEPVQYYTFYLDSLTGSDLSQLPPDAVINTSKFILKDNQHLTVGPFFAPLEGEDLWVHLQAQLSSNNWATARITFWKLDDDNKEIAGTRENHNRGFPKVGKTQVYYQTNKFTPLAGRGRYAVQLTRLENSNDGSILKVENAHSIRNRIDVVYPDDSLVRVTVRATEQPTGPRERKYNALWTRHTISYNSDTKQVDMRLRPSRSFADFVLHSWLITAEEPLSKIDVEGLYLISNSLPDPRLGYCDYSFDDADISLGQRIETICNVARVAAYWDDGVLTFSRDEAKKSPAAIFNKVNMVGSESKISYEMTMTGGYDGVELEYVDPKNNNKAYLRYRIDDNGVYEEVAKTPFKIALIGCRNEYQARDRALLEVDRLIYQRTSTSIKTLADGGYCYLGDMILIADAYDKEQQAGYISGRNGDSFDTSERVNFEYDDPVFVQVTDSLGRVTDRYPVTPRSDTEYGFTAPIPNIVLNIYDGYDVQSPSRFIISTYKEMESMRWTVSDKKPNADGTYSITATEYFDAKPDYSA